MTKNLEDGFRPSARNGHSPNMIAEDCRVPALQRHQGCAPAEWNLREIFRFSHRFWREIWVKFSVARPNPGKRSTENSTKISRLISRHLSQRKTEKIFTSALLQGSCSERHSNHDCSCRTWLWHGKSQNQGRIPRDLYLPDVHCKLRKNSKVPGTPPRQWHGSNLWKLSKGSVATGTFRKGNVASCPPFCTSFFSFSRKFPWTLPFLGPQNYSHV